ncbi:MAG: Rrf2 family transcriptional regulator [Candidatus Bipolaricaulia bacterium]
MLFSRSTQYALQALVKVSETDQGEYVTVTDLSDEIDVPKEFLAKIFQELAKRGILESRRGRGGGFRLSRPPGEIDIYEIVELIDGTQPMSGCIFDGKTCHPEDPCPLHNEWIEIREEIIDFTRRNSVKDLAGG